jgi:hypothetical protein
VQLYDVANGSELFPADIIVDASVKGKWTKGAEILITSHSQDWMGQQVRRIAAVSDYKNGGLYVQIKLDKPIKRPTTLVQSRDFAVEVALLSRNIVFQGGVDVIKNHGAHFWVMFTPIVIQKLEGVEFINFGQQGLIGRYPIHFHMSGSVKGSVVAKNSIHQSNQRCIVVHGTDDLLIEENIAYDTKGHCFMLEDGIETRNMFKRNLGALSKIPEMLISPIESDNFVSTFWITNPLNSYQGNVAAGSEMIGYWFEPLKRGQLKDLFPHLTPDKDPLTLFQGNVAHSNDHRGIQTYPTGYEPRTKGSAIFDGIKSYRNAGAGLFFHISRNIIVRDAIIADNKEIGIDIDRADAIQIIDTLIVGESISYGYSVDNQDSGSVCHFDGVYGIDLHTWKNNPDEEGITLQRVRFRGYSDDICPNAVPFRFDNIVRSKNQRHNICIHIHI